MNRIEGIACNAVFARRLHVVRRVIARVAFMLFLAWSATSGRAEPARAQDDATALETPVNASEAPIATPDAALPTEGSTPAGVQRDDMTRWLERKHRGHELVMAAEARLLYRRGLIARQSGDWDQAVALMRGAAELDPTFTGPQWTLASWYVFRDPGEALHQIAALVEVARESFVVQLDLVANTAFLLVQSTLLGLLLVGLLLVLVRGAEIRHALQEHFLVRASRGSAIFWSWVAFVAPFVVGIGLVLPTAAALAFLWPFSKPRERAIFVMLVAAFLAAPLAWYGMQKLVLPMHRDEGPFYGVHMMQNEAFSDERHALLTERAEQNPDNPFLQFGVGWMARQGNDPVGAEAAYRRTMLLMPGNDRVLNNLGNALAQQGRYAEAVEIYQQAIGINPENAAAFYNMAQAYTQQFMFRESNEALTRASALDFDLVRLHQAEITEDGVMPRVDQWLAPATFWRALVHDSSPGAQPLPPAWRGALEKPGSLFPLALVLAVIAALAGGMVQKRTLPLRRCDNCDRVVCRRCASRRRQVALCNACAQAESGAASNEFARRLLRRQRDRTQRFASTVRTGLSVLVPGFGMVVHRHLFGALVMLSTIVTLLTVAAGYGAPFSYEASPRLHELEFSQVWTYTPWVLLYLTSLLAYARAHVQARARREAAARPVQRHRATKLREAA